MVTGLKRWFCLLLALAFFLPPLQTQAAEPAEAPDTYSDAYVVMDADTGQVLVAKNADKREYPASITKVLTCALVLENGISMEEVLTASEEAVQSISYDSTQLYLAVGEKMTVEQLLYGTMVRSANDAANVLAERISGTQKAFAELMTQKAASLGAVNSHFVNPHGLSDDNHYTTAYDMALITRYALSIEGFQELFDTVRYTIPATNAVADARPLTTVNKLINPAQPYYYEYATGSKLGWTPESQYTLVSTAEKNGMRLICVAMRSGDDSYKYRDTVNLFDYCFDNFTPIEFTPAEAEAFMVPLFEGSLYLADVMVSGIGSYRFLVPKGVSTSDISASYDVPSRYEDAESIAPTVTFRLGDSSTATSLGTFPLSVNILPADGQDNSASMVLDATQEVARRPWSEVLRDLLWVIVPAGFLILLLTISLIVQLMHKNTKRYIYIDPMKRKYKW